MMDYANRIREAESAGKGGAASPRIKVAMIMAGPSGAHMIAGTDSFQADEIRAAGGDPVGPKADKFVPLNPENLLTDNPDFIVFAGKGEPFIQDSRFAGLKAIKAGHVANMDGDVALRKGSRVDKFINGLAKAIGGKGAG